MAKRIIHDVCGGNGHESCPLTWGAGDVHGTAYRCSCECHTPRATCRRCGMGGLAWAQFPQQGFRRNRLLVPTLFQPLSEPIKIGGFAPVSTLRHCCGIDAERAQWDYIECVLTEQYEEINERRAS